MLKKTPTEVGLNSSLKPLVHYLAPGQPGAQILKPRCYWHVPTVYELDQARNELRSSAVLDQQSCCQ